VEKQPKVKQKLTVRLEDDLYERLKIRAVKERRTLQTIVDMAIEQYLKTPLNGGSR
jgi:predicted transcriptional regulator